MCIFSIYPVYILASEEKRRGERASAAAAALYRLWEEVLAVRIFSPETATEEHNLLAVDVVTEAEATEAESVRTFVFGDAF